ncbi:PDZ domain-containing protein [Xanthomonadaceae bacterium JHOS43]|nr:PDZ domain-containing protein [Xanthomonadaceae bacterium JHOS43]
MPSRPILFPVALVLFAQASLATDPADTRMVREPANGGARIAFVYDNDLWLAGREGGTARRLTSAAGREQLPVFSPDGQWLAFSADYHGNTDVYVMPAGGGEAKRLTWHPGADLVRGFTPDGKAVLFSSPRSVHTNRHTHLYTVPVEGGVAQRLPIPSGSKAAISPDGRRIAYTPLGERFNQWKHYRGGTQSRIWIMDLSSFAVTEVPKPASGSNDTDPMWQGERLLFSSDRDGEFNLYAWMPGESAPVALTALRDFPVLSPSIGSDGSVVFEHGGALHRLDAGASASTQLAVSAVSDLTETRPRIASGAKWVRDAAPSPDLKRLALEYRGEIVTVPAEKGDPRNLSNSPGAHDRSPAWSADGKQVAWFSDAGGEYALHVARQDGRGETRRHVLDGAGFYDQLAWSPDGRHLSFRDNSQSLWIITLASGKTTKIASEPVYTPLNLMRASWSPDARWLAYTVQNAGLIQTVNVYSLETGRSTQISDGLSEAIEPVFDPKGEFLYLLASTDAGPVKDWFAQSSADMGHTYSLHAVTLRSDGPHPLPPQSDEPGEAAKSEAAEKKGEKNDVTPAMKPVRIDFDRIGDRIVALPLGSATRRNLAVGASGELYFIETVGRLSFGAFDGPGALKRYSLDKRDTKTLADGVEFFALSNDGKKIVYKVKEDWFVTEVGDKLEGGKGKVDLAKVSVDVAPRAEWAQILDEVWRINRDYFYATNFHGADWPAMREKYRALLPHAATRFDVDRLIQWMLSELSVGHSYIGLGESIHAPAKVGVGLLGADYAIKDGKWQFSRVYGGLNWEPNLRAPLRAPGIDVRDGEFLLAVDGRPLSATDNPYAAFENRVGRQVRVRIGPNANGNGAREVVVEPIDSEVALRYRAWVEGNLNYVTEKTGGRVAYVHVPDTAGGGHTSFKRYFYPQSHREAIIVDERYNGGGQVADYYIDILRRPFVSRWVLRYGEPSVTPRGAIFGPKVMLTDETAGSGGDLLPWMFQRFKLGPVIGKRTWGGLVGILGFPVLMDGGSITSPNLAIWTEDGYAIENVGVAPDIEVEQWPAEVNAGRDPQLDRAIEVLMKQLPATPPKTPAPPPFPRRALGPGNG